MRSPRQALALLLTAVLMLTLLGGCSVLYGPSERVILLPGASGRSGGLLVGQHLARGQRAPDEIRLDEPFAQTRANRGGALGFGVTDAATVERDFGPLLAITPARARSFFVNFLSNSDQLTHETAPVLRDVVKALQALPAGEVIVIGHTDNVGSEEANDRLALDRARAVGELLVKLGVPATQIALQARGMREPLVQVPPQTDEPRNRRVEIKLR